jgi:hypothetical protein
MIFDAAKRQKSLFASANKAAGVGLSPVNQRRRRRR